MGLQGHRALSSCAPLTRLCAELRPPQGFAEQSTKSPGTMVRLASGEALDDVNGAATRQAVAAMLEGIATLNGSSGCNLSEIFDVCMAQAAFTGHANAYPAHHGQ
eukprot:CAMPEP_0115255600 /NCGR_PEP_ID=MMETSP0270-20121206/45804_1 /TAXON_ID=71861 /ORGANISM="Scrippsiella trochoidea, Strain CCMP3099" /LENGTH=104 /DNA_ID=CAMNT_0002671207 /DNA_START=147 /DNA_END=462 /DNA_ORIENTATION=-